MCNRGAQTPPVEGWGGLGVGVRLDLGREGYQSSVFQLQWKDPPLL